MKLLINSISGTIYLLMAFNVAYGAENSCEAERAKNNPEYNMFNRDAARGFIAPCTLDPINNGQTLDRIKENIAAGFTLLPAVRLAACDTGRCDENIAYAPDSCLYFMFRNEDIVETPTLGK